MNDRSRAPAVIEAENKTFFELLNERAKTTLLCVDLLPRSLTAAEALQECRQVIHRTKEYAAAYKPVAAYFEVFGPEGWSALREVIASIPAHIPCILDGKRGDDLPAASNAYARSAFQYLNAHAVTVSPYLGEDSVRSFTQYKDKGVWVVCKTKNKGSQEVQCLPIKGCSGKLLYEVLAEEAVTKWGVPHKNVGLVVEGWSEPQAVQRVRSRVPLSWILVPDNNAFIREGEGAKKDGGTSSPPNTIMSTAAATMTTTHIITGKTSTALENIIRAGIRPLDKSGILLSVLFPLPHSTDPREAAKELVTRMNEIRFGRRPPAQESQKNILDLGPLAAVLLSSHAVEFGNFPLKSGKYSPIRIDLGGAVGFPQVMKLAANEYAKVLKKYSFDRIAGIPYTGLPFAAAVAVELNVPLIYARKEGRRQPQQSHEPPVSSEIEGVYQKGERIVVLDDVVRTGETKMWAIKQFREAGLEVVGVVVLIDPEIGGKQLVHQLGCTLEAVAGLHELLTVWEDHQVISPAEAATVRKFLAECNSSPSHL